MGKVRFYLASGHITLAWRLHPDPLQDVRTFRVLTFVDTRRGVDLEFTCSGTCVYQGGSRWQSCTHEDDCCSVGSSSPLNGDL